jgi:hypothetical protein
MRVAPAREGLEVRSLITSIASFGSAGIMACDFCNGSGEVESAFVERSRKGEQLRKKRLRRGFGWTQAQLASRLGDQPGIPQCHRTRTRRDPGGPGAAAERAWMITERGLLILTMRLGPF